MDETIYDKVVPTGGKRSRHQTSRHKRSRHKRSRHKRSRHKQEKRRRRDISRKLGRRHRRRTFRKLYGGAGANWKIGTRTPKGLGAGRGAQGLGGKFSGKYEEREKMDDEVRKWRGAELGDYSEGRLGPVVFPRRDHLGAHRLDKTPYLSYLEMAAKEAAAAKKAAVRRSMPPPPPRSASPKPPMPKEHKEYLEGLVAKAADRLRRAQSPRTFGSPPPPPSPGFTFARSGKPFSPTTLGTPTTSGTPKAAFPTGNDLPYFAP